MEEVFLPGGAGCRFQAASEVGVWGQVARIESWGRGYPNSFLHLVDEGGCPFLPYHRDRG